MNTRQPSGQVYIFKHVNDFLALDEETFARLAYELKIWHKETRAVIATLPKEIAEKLLPFGVKWIDDNLDDYSIKDEMLLFLSAEANRNKED